MIQLPLAYSAFIHFLFSFQKAQSTMDQLLTVVQCLNERLENIMVTEEGNKENPFTFISNIVPVYLFDGNHNHFKKYKRFPHFAIINETIAKTKVYPMSSFLITVSSRPVFISLLIELRESIWWNNEAHFLIYNNDKINGCKFVRQFLHATWDFNILSVIYFCINEQAVLSAFTFNPYDRFGSAFWKIVPGEDDQNDYWTLLLHSFSNSTDPKDVSLRCNDLNLDRTKNLNYFNVKIGSNKMEEVLLYNHKIEVYNDMKLIVTLLNKLNASCTYKHYSNFGVLIPEGPTSYLKEIQSSSLNVVTICSVAHYDWRLQTYPHEYQQIRLVTPKETFTILLLTFTSSVIILLLITSSSTIIFFTLILYKPICWSLLEFLRMLTNNSTLISVQQPLHRYIFINLIFLIYITNVFLQCFISAYSTVPKYKPMIESIEDLLNSKLLLSAAVYHKEFMYGEELLRRFVPGDPLKCIKDSSSGKKIACAVHYVDLAFENTNNVHIARDSLAVGPSTFTVSPDWPLLAKFNQLLQFAFESGIYQYLSVHSSALKFSKRIRTDGFSKFEPLQLDGCFYIFFGGCGLAFGSLLIELVVHKFNDYHPPNIC